MLMEGVVLSIPSRRGDDEGEEGGVEAPPSFLSGVVVVTSRHP